MYYSLSVMCRKDATQKETSFEDCLQGSIKMENVMCGNVYYRIKYLQMNWLSKGCHQYVAQQSPPLAFFPGSRQHSRASESGRVAGRAVWWQCAHPSPGVEQLTLYI